MKVPGSDSSALQTMYFGFVVALGDEAPLDAAGEAGAAAAAQPGGLDLLDDRLGGHREALGEPLVAAAVAVALDAERLGVADVAQEDGLEAASDERP